MFFGRYEIQVLDSFENPTYADGGAAAIYGQHPPLVNASRPPGQWQTYDIIFTAPRFKPDGSLESPAYVTMLHNGVLVHNHAAVIGAMAYRAVGNNTRRMDRRGRSCYRTTATRFGSGISGSREIHDSPCGCLALAVTTGKLWAGLFVLRDRAWLAISEFCRSGGRSSEDPVDSPGQDVPPRRATGELVTPHHTP